jgi:Fe-S-cluster containining protein
MSEEEVGRLAAFLKISEGEVLSKYCRRIGERISLDERRMPNGNYDCIFLKEIDPPAQPASKQGKLESAEVLPMKRRGCSIYPVRPLQCRTWPFWHGNLASRQAWDLASKKCPGMDRGKREFSQIQIEELRDARDWPEKPPTSAG